MSTPDDGRPRLAGRIGSLEAFWPLMEPLLAGLRPRRLCEVGVDQGILTRRLLAWSEANGCAYVGIDPAPASSAVALIHPPNLLVLGRSLEILPELEPCEAYFIDGDHNYHTVRHELELIAHAAPAGGPMIFAHDVGWPWARRDMYHSPDDIPADARHPFSADLGVSLEDAELTPEGLRSPGRYVIARPVGGTQNGVLTAVEDFLRDHDAEGWRATVVPIAYGLAILCRPDVLPAACRLALDELSAAGKIFDLFLESCEANFLSLYLYAEATKTQLGYWTGDGQPGQSAYEQLQATYSGLQASYEELAVSRRELERSYRDLSTHSEALLGDYHRLLEAYRTLERSVRPPS